MRRDGSSLFGAEERFNTYYRVSGAYPIAEEPWWPLEQVSEFKLRYSRGTAGNRPSYGDKDAILSLGAETECSTRAPWGTRSSAPSTPPSRSSGSTWWPGTTCRSS